MLQLARFRETQLGLSWGLQDLIIVEQKVISIGYISLSLQFFELGFDSIIALTEKLYHLF